MNKMAADQTKILVSLLVLHVILALCLLASVISFRIAPIFIFGFLSGGCGILITRISRDSDAARHIVKSRSGKVYLYCMWGICACGVLFLIVSNYLAIFMHPR
ncbi:hypothetical protein [Burkholderia ambifaria]|uniref:hypothetical protein n=1 Tax=Burkholderia ambifaria TaxID=152480 RepID=UPI00158E8268|nr:hypothetical protein [Burkholderia ambifaria]